MAPTQETVQSSARGGGPLPGSLKTDPRRGRDAYREAGSRARRTFAGTALSRPAHNCHKGLRSNLVQLTSNEERKCTFANYPVRFRGSRDARLASVTSPAWAGPSNAPFTANLAISETLADPSSCPEGQGLFAKGMIAGVGVATKLGVVTGMASDCIYATTPPNFEFQQGRLVLVTASGDSLFITYSGQFTFDRAPVPVPGCAQGGALYSIKGSFLITGGTGRLLNAAGQGTLTGSEAITNSPCQPPYFGRLELNGRISY